ncbi:hypothetical protein OROHE_019131 [Orobanche hederae]
MAEHLASIFGTEKDRVNCPFYFKIGACRHGDRCARLHTKPAISPTLVLSNMYMRPDMMTPGVDPQGQPLDPKKTQSHFEDFYEDLFQELSKFGDIQCLNICDNLADHMVGNVYIQFREEDQAMNALQNLTGRSYEGRPIIVDFSPVTDFREATCRQYEENVCNRGGYCNFMHLKKISKYVWIGTRRPFFFSNPCYHDCWRFDASPLGTVNTTPEGELRHQLFRKSRGRHGRSRSRSHSPRHRNYEDRRDSGRSGGDHRHHDRGRRPPPGRNAGYRGGRSRSPDGRRSRRSPVRENSAERRAKIELWNKEKEEAESAIDNSSNKIDDGWSNANNLNQPRQEDGGYDY